MHTNFPTLICTLGQFTVADPPTDTVDKISTYATHGVCKKNPKNKIHQLWVLGKTNPQSGNMAYKIKTNKSVCPTTRSGICAVPIFISHQN